MGPLRERARAPLRPRRAAEEPGAPVPARDRFLDLDGYRVAREWSRYEGTAQRDLFRELRQRFLARHRTPGRWVVDLGSGPGRFSDALGTSEAERILVDLAGTALRPEAAPLRPIRRSPLPWHRLRGDAARPPLRAGRFADVALLGNVLGFSGGAWETVLDRALELLAPHGTLLLESVAGPGERSRYLHRLPPGAVARAIGGPPGWLRGRVEREGFDRAAARSKPESDFRRLEPAALSRRLERRGWVIVEAVAVAPALGSEPERVEAVRPHPDAWRRLLELEEGLGRAPARLAASAAYLVAIRAADGPAGRIPSSGVARSH